MRASWQVEPVARRRARRHSPSRWRAAASRPSSRCSRRRGTQPGIGDRSRRQAGHQRDAAADLVDDLAVAHRARASIAPRVPGSSSAPLWGGPPAIARSQKLPHIWSQATVPSAPYFSPADPIEIGCTSSYDSWYSSGSRTRSLASSSSSSVRWSVRLVTCSTLARTALPELRSQPRRRAPPANLDECRCRRSRLRPGSCGALPGRRTGARRRGGTRPDKRDDTPNHGGCGSHGDHRRDDILENQLAHGTPAATSAMRTASAAM